jgi:hypothetical protein
MIARIIIDDEEEESIVECLLCPRNRPVSSWPTENFGVRRLIMTLSAAGFSLGSDVNAPTKPGFRMWTEGPAPATLQGTSLWVVGSQG